MNNRQKEDELIVRYLLGQLNETEREQVEHDYFHDDGYYERLSAVENEMIDAYVRGEIEADHRLRFEERFLSDAAGLEKVAFARDWQTYLQRSFAAAKMPPEHDERPRPRAFQLFGKRLPLLPLAAAALIILGAWMAIYLVRLNSEIKHLRTQRAALENSGRDLEQKVTDERLRNQQLLADLAAERSRRKVEEQADSTSPLPVIASFLLRPGLTRDTGDANRYVLPPDATQVRLRAVFKAGDFTQLYAELQTVEGRVIWSERNLTTVTSRGEKIALVTVPSRRLKNEDYILILSGVAPTGERRIISEYSFRIVN